MALFKKIEIFFFTKNHSFYRKSKNQIFPEFLVDNFNPKKIKHSREHIFILYVGENSFKIKKFVKFHNFGGPDH